jgi:hypothetical protein
VKGANPRVRHSTIRMDRGIRLNKLRMVDIVSKTAALFHRIILVNPQHCYRSTIGKPKHTQKSAFFGCATSSAARAIRVSFR